MASYSTFERDQKGYTSISQTIDGKDIEGTTFVAFDSVAFAKATGQVGLLSSLDCESADNMRLCSIDNTDNRWVVADASVRSDGEMALQYTSLGDAIYYALIAYGVEYPRLADGHVPVRQSIGHLKDSDYIGDGSFCLQSSTRQNDQPLPMPYSEVALLSGGGLAIAVTANYDPGSLFY